MPAFDVEFVTGDGPRRGQFTLDPERGLGPQVRQVLEELRQHGVVVAGGPGDELVVSWSGRELDLGATPAALGVTPQRALEIRMRPAARPERPPPAPEPRPVRVRRFTRGAYASILTGAAGGLLAWGVSASIRDLGTVVSTYARLDLLVAALLGASAGAFILAGAARRRQDPAGRAALAGLALGAAGGALGAAAGLAVASVFPDGGAGFRLGRMAAWALLGASASAAIALAGPRRGVLEAAAWGTAGGALGGLAFSLSGPGDFWQALGFALTGAACGAGAGWPVVRRAEALIEVEAVAGREPGLLGHREWALAEGGRVHVRGAASFGGGAFVALEAGRCWIGPAAAGEAVVVSGHPLGEPAELRDGDRIDLGGARFRFRRLVAA